MEKFLNPFPKNVLFKSFPRTVCVNWYFVYYVNQIFPTTHYLTAMNETVECRCRQEPKTLRSKFVAFLGNPGGLEPDWKLLSYVNVWRAWLHNDMMVDNSSDKKEILFCVSHFEMREISTQRKWLPILQFANLLFFPLA